MLSLSQARRQAFWLGVVGWVLGIACLGLLVVSALKGVYGVVSASTASPFVTPFRRLIEGIYGMAAEVAPTLTELVWKLAPQLDLSGPLIAPGNWGFFLVYFLMLLSLLPRGRATRIRRALAEHQAHMQQVVWAEQVRQKMSAGASAVEAQQGLDIRISVENQPVAWHQGLWGVVVLGIALPLVVDLIKLYVGLSK